jgi:hypothetical protein
VAAGAALAAVAVAASSLAAVEHRRRADLEARVERLERQRDPAVAPPGTTAAPSGDERDPLSALLDALGGGGAGELLGGAALGECAEALGGATEGGLSGLFGGGGTPPTDAGALVRETAAAVEELRQLRFRRVPEPRYLPPEELRRRVAAEVEKELEPAAAAADARLLTALGALEPGADLRDLMRRALGEQVAGFYDPETEELVVRRPEAGGMDASSRLALAHELDHALADQVLGLPVDEGRPSPGAEDAALARLALVEGDATLAMQLYGLRHVSLAEQLGGLGGALAAQQQLATLPHHLQRSLTFPYLQGLGLVCRLHATGGWKAVDQAYGDPPTTTAQVLFPDRYLGKEAAVDPRDPSPPGPGWRAGPKQAFGAAQLLWLLEAPGGDPGRALDEPRARAGGWAGGEVQAWADGDRTAVSLALRQRAGERALCATMADWYRAAFPGGREAAGAGEELAVDGTRQDAVVRCSGDDVRVGIGPDLVTARALAR